MTSETGPKAHETRSALAVRIECGRWENMPATRCCKHLSPTIIQVVQHDVVEMFIHIREQGYCLTGWDKMRRV
jgi:hypothetical protein